MISNNSFTSMILILGTYSIIILYRHKIFRGQKNTKMLLFRFIISPLLTQFFPIKIVWNDFCFSVPGQILLLNQTQISYFQESFPYPSNPLFELYVPPTVIITLDFKLFMFFFPVSSLDYNKLLIGSDYDLLFLVLSTIPATQQRLNKCLLN